MRKWVLLAAVSITIAGCDSLGGDSGRETREWRVQPDEVDAESLRAAVSDSNVKSFYDATGWQPVWTKQDAQALQDIIGGAPNHGLNPTLFLDASAPSEPAEVEAALTKAAIGYAVALARGHVDPTKVSEVYTVPRPNTDVVRGLAQALRRGLVGDWFASLPPQTAEYRALSKAFVHYLRQASTGGASGIAAGDAIKPGASDPRLVQVIEALQTNGYLPEPEQRGEQETQGPGPPPRYTPQLAAAVKRMQSDYGIEADGIIGAETLQVLNTGAGDRARQLAVNLERLRWLERNPAATRIDVNTAAAFLHYWRDGVLVDQRRVVVGQPEWETPELGSPIFQLVANPTWTVPESIEKEEIAPKGPGYLALNNMIRKNGRIVQMPGPENSLGQVKFAMRNDHAIYLHDTPAKALFAENERHRSHGCVRVDDAIGFARLVAGHEGVLSDFDEGLMSGDETFVDLRSMIPVRLMYRTVFVDDAGRVRFRTDAYGWDSNVAVGLGLERRGRRTLRQKAHDVGP